MDLDLKIYFVDLYKEKHGDYGDPDDHQHLDESEIWWKQDGWEIMLLLRIIYHTTTFNLTTVLAHFFTNITLKKYQIKLLIIISN